MAGAHNNPHRARKFLQESHDCHKHAWAPLRETSLCGRKDEKMDRRSFSPLRISSVYFDHHAMIFKRSLIKCKVVVGLFFSPHAQRHHFDAKQETRVLGIDTAFKFKWKQEVSDYNCIIFKKKKTWPPSRKHAFCEPRSSISSVQFNFICLICFNNGFCHKAASRKYIDLD